MVNLLTTNIKRFNRLNYIYRLVVLVLVTSLIAVACGLVIDLGRWGVVAVSDRLLITTNLPKGDEVLRRQISEEVRLSNRHVALLANLEKDPVLPSVLIETVLAARPTGLKINRLSYQVTAGGDILTIIGVSQNRLQIVDFAKALEGLPGVAIVDSPLENLLQGKDPAFTISIKMKPLKKI